MDTVDLSVIILGGMLVTAGQRAAFILFFPPERLPPLIRRGLRFVAPAVLSAIVLPGILAPQGEWALDLHPPRILAGGLAALVAWRARSIWLTILVGLVALWVLRLLST
jgi:branched-subunit amino acid transport protein